MVGGHHVLTAGFGPLHWATEFAGKLRYQNFLAVDLQLPTETTTHIGCDHAQVVLRNAGDQCEQESQDMGHLGRGPQSDFVTHAHGRTHDAAGFHECWNKPLVNEPALDHYVSVLCSFVVSTAKVVDVAGVGSLIVVDEGRTLCDRAFHIDNRGKWFVINRNRFEGVSCTDSVGCQN